MWKVHFLSVSVVVVGSHCILIGRRSVQDWFVVVLVKSSEGNTKMNPPCARCKKTVYPMEKLNCLDKYWHKGCFKCEVCDLTLTMKTYKGYNKLPYCNVHYPTTKFTAVADTPENKRLAKNTSQQSAIVYHKEFEAEKGKLTQVADDPETLRLQKTAKQASDIAYKGNVTPQQPALNPRPGSYGAPPPEQNYQPPPQHQPAPQPVPQPASNSAPASKGPTYLAQYDYTAADEDEVSFQEGDIIVNVEVIDDGWVTGTVEKTGQTGMIPSNYIEKM